MARAFSKITFTPSVKAAQERYGSRAGNQGFETAEDGGDTLTAGAIEFIEARDGFYQATSSETGWPYVQFRGGPAGFLKVIDERTLGYADFCGNVQYLSVGNLGANDRIALILMDYPNRRRLKIWARARIVDYAEDPALVSSLEMPSYRASVERAVVLTIEALDWNCPQHITPRFTEAEIDEFMAPLRQRITALETQVEGRPASKQQAVLGDGPLELVIAGIRQLTPEVRAYELRHPEFQDLPVVAAGAHILVPVPFGDKDQATRSYSIASNPGRRDAYEIAVRREPEGGGGSRAIHAHYALGQRLRITLPKDAFSLHDDARPTVLIAGGIGITPLKSMAQALTARGHGVQLHYAARSRALMAYGAELSQVLENDVIFYPGDEGKRLDIAAIISQAPKDAVFYVCGPERLIDSVRELGEDLGLAPDRVRFELFAAGMDTGPQTGDVAFDVHLARTDKTLRVAEDRTILDAMIDAGVTTAFSCKTGVCGTCTVKVLDGTPVHRDLVLSPADREDEGKFCPCVSRAATERLVLDM